MKELFQALLVPAVPGLIGILAWILKEMRDARKATEAERAKRADKTEEILERLDGLEKGLSEVQNAVKEVKETSALIKEGEMSTKQYMLQRYHDEYMAQKFITSQQKRVFLSSYEIYDRLDGNGVAKGWRKDIENLPVRDDLPVTNPYMEIFKKSLPKTEGKWEI